MLSFSGTLYGAKDVSNFALEHRKLEINDASARVKDNVYRSAERRKVMADGFTHATFDAVAIDGLPHDLAYCKTYPRATRVGVT